MLGTMRFRVAAYLSLGFASLLIVGLSFRLISLNRAYTNLKSKLSGLHEGIVVPSFQATTLAGDTLTIGETPDLEAKHVLFILTTTCPFCQATVPVWAGLADSASRHAGTDVLVVGISLDGPDETRRFIEAFGVRFPVLAFPSEKYQSMYRATTVPQTVILNSAGAVLFAHTGQLRPGPILDSAYRALRREPPRQVAGR